MDLKVSDPVSTIISTVGGIVEKIIPDPVAQANAKLELVKLQQNGELAVMANDIQLAQMQANVNVEEAKSGNFFTSGWRPYIGWICGTGLAYQFLFRPIFGWICENLLNWTQPPALELGTLLTLLTGMLGLGGMRTYEKWKNVEGNR